MAMKTYTLDEVKDDFIGKKAGASCQESYSGTIGRENRCAEIANIQIGKRKEHYPVFTDALVLGNGNSSYAGHGRNW